MTGEINSGEKVRNRGLPGTGTVVYADDHKIVVAWDLGFTMEYMRPAHGLYRIKEVER